MDTEEGCDGSQQQQDTAPLTGRGGGRAWLPKSSPNPSHQTCPEDLAHQPQLLPLFLCASSWVMRCSIQISKALKKSSEHSQPLPQTLCGSQTHEKHEKEGKRRCVQTFAVAAHQCMQSFQPHHCSQAKVKMKAGMSLCSQMCFIMHGQGIFY